MTAPLAISLPDGSHAQAIVILPDGSHAVCVIGPDGAPCCCGGTCPTTGINCASLIITDLQRIVDGVYGARFFILDSFQFFAAKTVGLIGPPTQGSGGVFSDYTGTSGGVLFMSRYDEDQVFVDSLAFPVCFEYQVSLLCIDGQTYVRSIAVQYFAETTPPAPWVLPPNDSVFFFNSTSASNPYNNPSHPPAAVRMPKIAEGTPNLNQAPDEVDWYALGWGGSAVINIVGDIGCLTNQCGETRLRCLACDGSGESWVIRLQDAPTWARSFRVADKLYPVVGTLTEDAAQNVDEWLVDGCPGVSTTYEYERCDEGRDTGNPDPMLVRAEPLYGIGVGGAFLFTVDNPGPGCRRITYYRATTRPASDVLLVAQATQTACTRANVQWCPGNPGDPPDPFPNNPAAPRDSRPTYRIPDDETPEQAAAAARNGGCCGPPIG